MGFVVLLRGQEPRRYLTVISNVPHSFSGLKPPTGPGVGAAGRKDLVLENCLCLPTRPSRCPGQLQPDSEDRRIPRLPLSPQEADPTCPGQSFTSNTCLGGCAPPLNPSLSEWNLVNPPPGHPGKGTVHEPRGPGPHNVEETPSAPALSRPGSHIHPPRGSPSPEGSSSSKDTQVLAATAAPPAGCGRLLASTASTDEQE